MEEKNGNSSAAIVILAIIVFSCAAFSVFRSKSPTPMETPQYTIDNSQLVGTSNTQVNVFESFEVRTVVFKLNGGEQVSKIEEDTKNNFCKISYLNKEGWLNCSFLKKI